MEYFCKGRDEATQLKKNSPSHIGVYKKSLFGIIELIFQEELFTELKDTQGKPATTKSDVQDCK